MRVIEILMIKTHMWLCPPQETLKDDDCCKEVIRQIASLEGLVQNVSGEFDARSVHIVNSQG